VCREAVLTESVKGEAEINAKNPGGFLSSKINKDFKSWRVSA
jgi:hypothetical protein